MPKPPPPRIPPLPLAVYIPTRGRVGLNRQITLREFLTKSATVPTLVCPEDEVAAHREYHPQVVGHGCDGISATRQWILDMLPGAVQVVVDDDKRFYRRPDPLSPTLATAVPGDLDNMLRVITECVRLGYAHGGVAMRQRNGFKDLAAKIDKRGKEFVRCYGYVRDGHVFEDCERAIGCHFYARNRVRAAGLRYDAVPLIQDMYGTLTLLRAGLPNTIIYSFCHNEVGSNAAGGCSLFRTPELHAAAAETLARDFPGVVRVTTKVAKASSPNWVGMKTRTDVHVQFLKAYLASPTRQEATWTGAGPCLT